MSISLSISQQYEFEELAAVGCSIVDALMVGAGFTPAAAEKARDDAGLLALWEQSRARGASKILNAMSKAAAAGSSSAAKLVLDSYGTGSTEQEERVRENRRIGHGKTIDYGPEVRRGFEAQRALHEADPEFSKPRSGYFAANGTAVFLDEDKSNG
jgi:hypothetical protein